MRRYTERQRDAYLAWLDEQWKQPSLTDLYLMRLCAVVARKFAKDPNEIKDTDFLVTFKTPQQIRDDQVKSEELKQRYEDWKRELALQRAMVAVGLTKDKVVVSNTRPAWACTEEPVMPDWMN